uniref:Sialophorin n=1 Tax=Monodelphis domestica TaxID=13616 RepID=F6SFQ5_MONDO
MLGISTLIISESGENRSTTSSARQLLGCGQEWGGCSGLCRSLLSFFSQGLTPKHPCFLGLRETSPVVMEIISPLTLLLLILTECSWASANSHVEPTDFQPLDTMSVTISSSAMNSSNSPLALEATLLPTSNSDLISTPSPTLDGSPLTSLAPDHISSLPLNAKDLEASIQREKALELNDSKAQTLEVNSDLPVSMTVEARDNILTTEVASSTTWTFIASGLTSMDKEAPSSTQKLATHTSTPTKSSASLIGTATMVASPSSISPPLVTSTEQGEKTTPVFKETTSSKVISANTTISSMTSFQVSQVSETTSFISLTHASPENEQRQDGGTSPVVILVVVLLVMTFLVILFLLWRRRQKKRTGALMLVGSGKNKGARDAWAGPVQVAEDQAPSGSAAMEGDTGNPEGEGTGRRPTLTTFFGKRRSRQGSVMLEDLEAGAATKNFKEEAVSLMENMDGTIENPEADGSVADGSKAGDGNLPSVPVTNV